MMTQPGWPASLGETHKQATRESLRSAWTVKLTDVSSSAQADASPMLHLGASSDHIYWPWWRRPIASGQPDRPSSQLTCLKQTMGDTVGEAEFSGLCFSDFRFLDRSKRWVTGHTRCVALHLLSTGRGAGGGPQRHTSTTWPRSGCGPTPHCDQRQGT